MDIWVWLLLCGQECGTTLSGIATKLTLLTHGSHSNRVHNADVKANVRCTRTCIHVGAHDYVRKYKYFTAGATGPLRALHLYRLYFKLFGPIILTVQMSKKTFNSPVKDSVISLDYVSSIFVIRLYSVQLNIPLHQMCVRSIKNVLLAREVYNESSFTDLNGKFLWSW